MYEWMSECIVHNYAFRKALGYVRNKKGKLGSENTRETFVSTTKQTISTRPPYLPSYLPLDSFVILLQIINSSLGEKKIVNEEKKTHRCFDVGFYLYAGPEEPDSPYHYLDPHQQLSRVMDDFYHNLQTPSAIFKECETSLDSKNKTIIASWKDCEGHMELFYYLEGVHAGMIKESSSEGELSAHKEGKAFVYKIKLVD